MTEARVLIETYRTHYNRVRIHGELLKLGYDIRESTIAECMARRPSSPTQTWQTFIRNHKTEFVAIDRFERVTVGSLVQERQTAENRHSEESSHRLSLCPHA